MKKKNAHPYLLFMYLHISSICFRWLVIKLDLYMHCGVTVIMSKGVGGRLRMGHLQNWFPQLTVHFKWQHSFA